MRKTLFIASFILATVSSFAQRDTETWSIQPKLGINLANITNSSMNPRLGLVIGAEAEYQATDIVSLSVGALYSPQGAKATYENNKITIKMNYINFPALVNVYVAEGFAIKLGIQPGLLVNNKMHLQNGTTEVEAPIKDAFRASNNDASTKAFDFSIPIGFSYDIANLRLEARYNWGITSALEIDNETGKNSVFQFTVGYNFTLQ